MTLWLQRREALWLRESYISWIKANLASEFQSPRSEISNGRPSTDRQPTVAQTSPFLNTSTIDLTLKFGATEFTSALTGYLRDTQTHTTSPILPYNNDRYNLYKQIIIQPPPNSYVSRIANMPDRVRTLPGTDEEGRKKATPSQFDFVLAIEDERAYQNGKGFDGEPILFNLLNY